jgi:acetyl-CoA carboxylase biotin carboxyl carrier protein
MANENTPDLAELREHARALAANLAGPLRRMRVRSGDASIEVEWQLARSAPGASGAPGTPGAPGAATTPQTPQEPGPADESEALFVTSPMVGTFYRSPEPGAAPFVDVGDTVLPGQTVAIVEAMKLFNPIASEHAGVIDAVLAQNGEPVEFDQPLLRLVPGHQNGAE